MDSSIISKIEKARQYAEEKNRVNITSFAATFKGNHDQYDVRFEDGAWRCDCISSPPEKFAAIPWPCSGS